MTGSLILGIAFVLCSPALLAGAGRPEAGQSALSLTPSVVESGSPELIVLTWPGAKGAGGQWLGHTLEFFPSGEKWIALAGVDVEAAPGPSTLHISVNTGNGTVDLSRTIDIHPARYRTARLTVAPKFVQPGPEEQKEIAADSELKAKVFSQSATEPLWHGDFRAPVDLAPTDSFGTRRVFNGRLASVHKGMDFRAPMGTVVRASNDGVVVLAEHLYYEGNCVVIDHGMGIYTLSMHFSRIDVREGQRVNAGDRVGLSGATGRVTGPHLHWAVRWQDAYLDPAKLLRLNLNALH